MKIIDSIKEGDKALFESLLDRYTHPGAFVDGYNILHETISRGQLELSKIAIKKCPDFLYGGDFPYRNSPCIYAINTLDINMIKIFDEHDVAFSLKNENGDLPLIFAIKTKNIEIILYVLNKYPNGLIEKNNKGQTPLHIAAQYGCSSDILEIIYTKSQDIPDTLGNFPLHLYGEYVSEDKHRFNNFEGSVSFLYKRNPEVLFEKTRSGNAPIHCLASLCPKKDSILFNDIVSILKPETLSITNRVGMLAVHIASLYHNVELVKEMISVNSYILYETTPTSKTIFDFLENCSNNEKLSLISHILTGRFELRQRFWDFIPIGLHNLEKHLHAVNHELLSVCMAYVSNRGKYHIKKNLFALHKFTRNNNIFVEPEILTTILLRSLTD